MAHGDGLMLQGPIAIRRRLDAGEESGLVPGPGSEEDRPKELAGWQDGPEDVWAIGLEQLDW